MSTSDRAGRAGATHRPSAAPSDLHCSLGEGRSFTDPVTNWTMISGVELDRDLAGMLQAGRYPSRYFPDFVHELLHHWCFHSPVGSALSLLQLRAQRNAMLTAAGDGSGGFEVAEHAVRYETAITLMRPLAEGLALFAEFDAFPGDSPVLSDAMLMVAISFTDMQRAGAGADWVEGLKRFLARHRSGTALRERKANLLAQPLSTAGGGYLPGYLTVRNLQLALIRQTGTDALADSDLFLTYLRTFFYGDLGFVATLLDPGLEITVSGAGLHDSADAISRYFQRRLGQLFAATTPEVVARMEEATLRGAEVWDAGLQIGVDPGHAALGRERLQAWVDDLDFDGAPAGMEQVLRRIESYVLAQRDLMCVGSFRAPVQVNEHHRALVGRIRAGEGDELPVLSIPAFPDVEAAAGDGSAEFFLSPAGRYSALAVSLGHDVVAVGSLSENMTEPLRQQIRGYVTNHAAAQEERATWRALLEYGLSRDPVVEVNLEHYRGNMERIARETYLGRALLYTPDASLAATASAMERAGFYDLFDGDTELVRALARLGLVSGIAPDREVLERVLREDGVDLSELVAKLRECEAAHDLLLVHEDGSVLFSTV